MAVTTLLRARWSVTATFKGYFAQQARVAYPEMDMGRELLTLNLSFGKITEASQEVVTGEMRQAFKALAALPPLQYHAPGEADRATVPRGDMAYEEVTRQPLFFNPLLERRPMQKRASPEQEAEMVGWATQGITRVEHVLNAHVTLSVTAIVCAHCSPSHQPTCAPSSLL